MVIIDHGKIINLPEDFINSCSQKIVPSKHWYDFLHHFFTDANMTVSFFTFIILAYFFFRGFEIPYVIRYWTNKVFSQEPEYLNCDTILHLFRICTRFKDLLIKLIIFYGSFVFEIKITQLG